MNWNSENLSLLGLHATEIAILDNLKTAKNVHQIAKETKLSRTGINHCLKNLIKKDLVAAVKKGSRQFYIAPTMGQLGMHLQRIVDEIVITDSVKKGVRIKTSTETEFKIYYGIKELIPAYERVVSLNKYERVCAIQPNKSWKYLHDKLSPTELLRFNSLVKENKLIVDGILHEDAYKLYKVFLESNPKYKKEVMVESFSDRSADYTAISPELFNYNAEIWIFQKSCIIINWKEEVAVEIANKDIMGFMRDMFTCVKQIGQKIDHSKAMHEILTSEPV